MQPIRDDLQEILITEQQIQQRMDALALEIQREYADKDLTLVAVLTGSVMFVADLLRRLPIPLRFDHIGVSSYHGDTHSTGDLTMTKALGLEVRGQHVLVVDDILDTGRTLVRIRQMMQKLQPRSLKFSVFLEKDVPHHDGFQSDFVGFQIPNKFVVGYGLDYQERYRNLPFVGTLRPEVMAGGV